MLLTEYDEKKHMKQLYREGYKKGGQDARQELLETLVRKKLQRGKDAVTIADELETEAGIIEEIIRRIRNTSQ